MRMTKQELFIMSNHTLKPVVDQIKDDQWDLKVPEEMSWQPDLTVRAMINYHAYDDAWVPDVLAGKTAEEVGTKYDGDLLGDDPKGNYAKYNEAANEVVKGFTDLDKTVHMSYGDFPAREYLEHITMFRGLRAYDTAKFIGVEPKLPDELVQALYEYVRDNADMLRANKVIPEPVPVPDDAPVLDRLLGLTGRDPKA
jgi:uncharacterized protein (TIGR03086 family)